MAPKGKSGVAMAGTTLSVTGPDNTISGTVISAAPSGLIIAGQTLTLPTPSPGATGDAVIIAGSTVTAGGSPAIIARIPAQFSHRAKRPLRLRTEFRLCDSIGVGAGGRIRVVGSSRAAGCRRQSRYGSDRGWKRRIGIRDHGWIWPCELDGWNGPGEWTCHWCGGWNGHEWDGPGGMGMPRLASWALRERQEDWLGWEQ